MTSRPPWPNSRTSHRRGGDRRVALKALMDSGGARLRGDGALVRQWPREERALSTSERYELQQLLVQRGFDVGGEPDGQIGPKSRVAIMNFQVKAGMVPDGFASTGLLDRLREQ